MERELADRVEAVLDAEVRPYLALHAGGIEVADLTAGGVLRVRLTGRCARCPAAQVEAGAFVADSVRASLPEVTDVTAICGVSDMLLAEAHRLLARRAARGDRPAGPAGSGLRRIPV